MNFGLSISREIQAARAWGGLYFGSVKSEVWKKQQRDRGAVMASSKKFVENDLVWAKMKGHPYWPARVN